VDSSRALQFVGLIIIAISIIAISYYFRSIRAPSSEASPTQQSNAGQVTQTSSENTSITAANSSATSNALEVDIPLGAGKRGTLSQYYGPAVLDIHKGNTVKWINRDSVGHTVTAVAFNSGLIVPYNSSAKSGSYNHTFNDSGTYTYFCQIHPYMSGTVYVDVEETQRTLTSTNAKSPDNIMIEIPYNSAYNNKYGPFFIPTNAIVPSNSKITWVNHDYVAHTATETEHIFDTKTIQPLESKSVVVSGEGTISYYCTIHPWMQASVTISPAK